MNKIFRSALAGVRLGTRWNMCISGGVRQAADLKEQLLGTDVIHQAGVVLIHHGQLTPGGAHIEAAHRGGLLQQGDGKWVVNKDLQDLQVRNISILHIITQQFHCSQYLNIFACLLQMFLRGGNKVHCNVSKVFLEMT